MQHLAGLLVAPVVDARSLNLRQRLQRAAHDLGAEDRGLPAGGERVASEERDVQRQPGRNRPGARPLIEIEQAQRGEIGAGLLERGHDVRGHGRGLGAFEARGLLEKPAHGLFVRRVVLIRAVAIGRRRKQLSVDDRRDAHTGVPAFLRRQGSRGTRGGRRSNRLRSWRWRSRCPRCDAASDRGCARCSRTSGAARHDPTAPCARPCCWRSRVSP